MVNTIGEPLVRGPSSVAFRSWRREDRTIRCLSMHLPTEQATGVGDTNQHVGIVARRRRTHVSRSDGDACHGVAENIER